MAVEKSMDHAALESRAAGRSAEVSGEFVDLFGERYYAIRNVDKMPPFFVSVISNDDHWLFVSSTGGLTAGRVSPDTALFPYVTVDKIHDSTTHTGSLTLFQVESPEGNRDWDPFAVVRVGNDRITRNVYKNVLGNKLCFEEVNHDLGLAFRYTWLTSDHFGFVRDCQLENLGSNPVSVRMLDGLKNILPAGTPRFTQTNSSNLVDAYKWTEYDASSGLAIFSLYSGITDRAEPCESLKANIAYCLGLDKATVLLSDEQVSRFREGRNTHGEKMKRGIRGAYLMDTTIEVAQGDTAMWQIVVNSELSQSDVVAVARRLSDRPSLAADVHASIDQGSDRLARIMASGDAFQTTAEENVATHHYANVLFNILRGGVFFDQYSLSASDIRRTIRSFNSAVYDANRAMLESLPNELKAIELLERVKKADDPQLERLCYEYLPITFGRRHGDPSRPWNQFAIRLRDEKGDPLLSYEGNWRDIFQNWEALALSFPEFIESMVAKFVNASTADGYNPYRITKEGIDWEVEDPEDPWSYIGYWGDHQIIYLQKLLELSRAFHPDRLGRLLRESIFCYANVPYRIRSFDALVADPKTTVDYDDALAERIEKRLEELGADGKLIMDCEGRVYQVNLLEKLLVPLLAKLGNLVIDGGIWMNTQRPEWNDANNALVGQGLSMVTLYYLRRYVHFLTELLADEDGDIDISAEIADWLSETSEALGDVGPALGAGMIDANARLASLRALGEAAGRYRDRVYGNEGFSAKSGQPIQGIRDLLSRAQAAIDHSIATNRRDDGLYHAYNLLDIDGDALNIDRLYPMLEGQVSALSTGAMPSTVAVEVLEALFESSVYRPGQQSFMLYPDRELPSFLEKNVIPDQDADSIPLIGKLVGDGDERIVVRDDDGRYRFNAELINGRDLSDELDALAATGYADEVEADREALGALYEKVFNHQAFTGRSGTMFGFEGLGCIYWHMVAKLLLAAQEVYFQALDADDNPATIQRLGELYYRVRHGIGFNKTPAEFGAFPYDPYSHTPKHTGAQQPGMTGQVKEEILTRFGELGIRVADGRARFEPSLLRRQEFVASSRRFRYLDVDDQWQDIDVPANGLAFSWCQVPVVYTIGDDVALAVELANGQTLESAEPELPSDLCSALFERNGRVRRISVRLPANTLFDHSD
jgi:hypothetical protein